MKAAFVPVWPGNPYHRELSSSLRAHGIEVVWPESLKSLYEAFRRGAEKPDILHLHALPALRFSPRGLGRFVYFYLRVARMIARGVTVVATVHNLHNHDSRHWRLEERISRFCMRWVSGLIVHGPTARSIIEERWRCHHRHIAIIPHGHYINSYRNEVDAAEARRGLRLDPSDFVFLFVGQLRPYKGTADMVNAFRACSQPSARLLIAGRPANKAIQEQLSRAIQDDTRIRFFPGRFDDDQVQAYMNAADIVVFPYQRVFTSGAVILAMSFGRPCLAAKIGGIADSLDNDGAIFFDPSVPGDLDRGFREAFAARAKLPDMGAYNLKRAAQWDWQSIGRATADFYEQCLSHKVRLRTEGAALRADDRGSKNANREPSAKSERIRAD